MTALHSYLHRFDHPIPAAVFSLGLGLWLLASLWSIVGGVLSQLTSLSFQLVALSAALLGAIGTALVVIGFIWYGFAGAYEMYRERNS